jgi:predicted Fe-S protein YdhL (DUF1289 family)
MKKYEFWRTQMDGGMSPPADSGDKFYLASDVDEVLQLVKYGYAPGNYESQCVVCDDRMCDVDKRCRVCIKCARLRRERVDVLVVPDENKTARDGIMSYTVELTESQRDGLTARGVDEIPGTRN